VRPTHLFQKRIAFIIKNNQKRCVGRTLHLLAIEHLKDGGVILFTTDASPNADVELEQLGKLINGKDMNLITILAGDCSNQDSWNVLP